MPGAGVGAVDLDSVVSRCRWPEGAGDGYPGRGELVAAVSGGPDSLALLALARRAGLGVLALHVDHGLRAGSSAEAERVAEAALGLGARFESLRAPVPPGPDLEARARAARYRVLPPGVMVGHTADDRAETVLLNLLRGAGLDGLSPMRPSARVSRPLVELRRSETEAVCAALGLDPLRDPSNDDLRIRRNAVRHLLVPMLSAISGRDPVPLLCRQADLLGDEADLLDELAATVDALDAGALRTAPTPLARRAVRNWLRGAEGADPELHPPSAAEVSRVLAVARGDAVACQIAGGRRVARREGRLRVSPAGSRVRAGVARVEQMSALVGSADGPDPRAEPPGGPRSVRLGIPAARRPGQRPAPPWDDPALGEIIVPQDELVARIGELGAAIAADYAGRPPLLVGVLKGACIFLSDLSRAIGLPVEMDFMAISSYGTATRTSGVVRIVKDLELDLTGRHVLIVEDIVDSGLTLSFLRRNLQARHPASLSVCALLVKDGLQAGPLDLSYEGFRIPPEFVVGYGLDVAERYRNLPFVCEYLEDRAPAVEP